MGKNCARGLEYGPRPRAVLKTSGTVFTHTDLPPVNNIYIFTCEDMKFSRESSLGISLVFM